MSAKKRLIPALVAGALAMGATGANAVTFNGVYVFGDSLSDTGYFRPFLTAALGSAAAANGLGRFTTNPGPIWAELIATTYGGDSRPSNAGGQNYAQGGARVTASSTSTPPGSAQRPVSTQITEYLNATGGVANPNGLYAVWAGANDIFQTLPAISTGAVDASTFLSTTAGAEVQQIGRLMGAGAKYVLVFNLPDIGSTPAFSNPALGGSAAQAGAGTQLSAGYNINLFNAIKASNLHVIPVDTFTLISEIKANAAAYGFTNTTGTACNLAITNGSSQFCNGSTLVPGATPTNYIFADGVHPTTGAHAILAAFVQSEIDGPNAYSTMAEVPLGSRAAHMRTLDEGLQSGMRAEVGKVTAFAAGDGGKYDISSNSLSPTTTSKNSSATAGVTFRLSEGATVGVGVGKTTLDATMGSLGKFSTSETSISVFGSFKNDGLYLNFSGTIADVNYNSIQRFVPLGPVTRVNNSSTKGSSTSGNVTVGYDWAFGKLSVGPFAGYTSQSVTVNGFTENAGAAIPASTDLRISDQTRNSRVGSVGLRVSGDFGNWTPFARYSYESDAGLKDRVVTASPVTVTQNITYDIPGYKGPNHWSTGTIGIRGVLAQRVTLGLSYTSFFGKGEVKQDGVSGSVAFAF